MTIVSSVNFGRNLLNQTFPINESPDEYHSRNGVVVLDEKPVQVFGWEKVEAQKKEATKTGLIEHWIDVGFTGQSKDRGIDLEWSFFQTPPIRNTLITT